MPPSSRPQQDANASYSRGNLAQSPSDYLAEDLNPTNSLDNYDERPLIAIQNLPIAELAKDPTIEQEPEVPQAVLGSQERSPGYSHQVDSQGYPCVCPWFQCYVHDAQLQDGITTGNEDAAAAFSFSTLREFPVSNVPFVSSHSQCEPFQSLRSYNQYYSVGRNTTDLTANTVSPGPPGDVFVQSSADQHVLSDRSGQGRSASKHTAGYCPTNSSASPMVFSLPESTRLDTGSGIGQSPEGPDSTGGESWAREFVWDSRTGNEVQVSGVKRRSEEEKEDLAKLREQGGACEECRRKHRKCSHRSGRTPEGKASEEHQSPDSRTSQRRRIATRNPELGNLSHNLSSQKPSRQSLLSPIIGRDVKLRGTNSLTAQAGNIGFDISGIDDFGYTGSQFSSAQSSLQRQRLEEGYLPEIPITAAELPQKQCDAIQLQDQYGQNVRREHNMGSNPHPYPSYLQNQAPPPPWNENDINHFREVTTVCSTGDMYV